MTYEEATVLLVKEYDRRAAILGSQDYYTVEMMLEDFDAYANDVEWSYRNSLLDIAAVMPIESEAA